MSHFQLTLRVDAAATEAGSAPAMLSKASADLRKQLYRSLGLKPHSVAWVTIAIGTPKGERVIRALADQRGALGFTVGSAHLAELPDAEEVKRADWYQLLTRSLDDFSLWDDYPGCKDGTLPKLHALNHSFVSSAFVASCERAKLRGVAFLRCASRGRKKGEPWFVALPDSSLGRGLDHPWFDRARWLRDVGDRPDRRASELHVGQSAFHQCWLREEAAGQEPLPRVLALCPTPATFSSGISGLQITTIPRFWSGALPAADFAYLPWGEDGPNREGKMMRFRVLAVSALARERLIGDGLFDGKAFLPVRCIETPEAGVLALDRLHDPVPPMYSPAELAALRAQEKRLADSPAAAGGRLSR